MKNPNLTSENFSLANRNYFIDFKRAINDSNYICITRSDKLQTGGYHRWYAVRIRHAEHIIRSIIVNNGYEVRISRRRGTYLIKQRS
ncbi:MULTISPECIES: hypothetical protein [Pedobacter]|uniref:hypothetical protein n=1 Tax=Pedobacter TaxID=84567 RepID=UPI001E313D58|nr:MULTISPECIES: hypothetical protein [Pedobacter]